MILIFPSNRVLIPSNFAIIVVVFDIGTCAIVVEIDPYDR